MITLRHIEIYLYYGGDGDALIRMGKPEDKEYMTYEIWRKIDELIQDISLIKTGITSKSYTEQVKIRLTKYCENKEVENKLFKLADSK